MIAEAFTEILYSHPAGRATQATGGHMRSPPIRGREILHTPPDHSLYTPRDFDLSPFFEIIKPTLGLRLRLHHVWSGRRTGRRP